MKKKNPRRSGKNVSDGRTGSLKDEWAVKRRMGSLKTNGQSKRRMGSQKTNGQSKDEWVVKRRMGNSIARLIDDDEVAIKY